MSEKIGQLRMKAPDGKMRMIEVADRVIIKIDSKHPITKCRTL